MQIRRSFAGLAAVAILATGLGWSAPARAFEPYLSQIQIFAFSFAPRGWALCDGQILPINQNQSLFSLLGTTYGGDGRTTFGLPDLRGRMPIHQGQGPGLSNRARGSRGGQQSVVLGVNEIPSHTHTATMRVASASGNSETPAAGMVMARDVRDRAYSTAAPNVDLGTQSVTVNNAGGSQGHENMAPFLTLNYSIAIQGLFPSRN